MSNVIKEGLSLLGNKDGRTEIPNCGRRELAHFLKEEGCNVGVEIGVQRAFFTKKLASTGMKIYGVDPWLSYRDYFVDQEFSDRQSTIFEAAKEATKKYSNIELIQKKSMDALADFEDESIDFVYIDGHHGFKYVTEDIYGWSRKVKKGGWIIGHDYAYSRKQDHYRKPYILQVKFVIDAYTKAFNIEKWYVLGAKHTTMENEKRDQYRSWMWQKTWDEIM